jgi:hypothetical protein
MRTGRAVRLLKMGQSGPQQGQSGIRAQVGRNFLGAEFVHTNESSPECGVGRLELIAHLLPRQRPLRPAAIHHHRRQEYPD